MDAPPRPPPPAAPPPDVPAADRVALYAIAGAMLLSVLGTVILKALEKEVPRELFYIVTATFGALAARLRGQKSS